MTTPITLEQGNGFKPDRLWSLWDMVELGIGRLLELHEALITSRALFQMALRGFKEHGDGSKFALEAIDYRKMLDAVAEVQLLAAKAGLVSTNQAATRTKKFLEQTDRSSGDDKPIILGPVSCGNTFQHLMDITSRIRDDCAARLYFQIDDADSLRANAPPLFGPLVFDRFPIAIEDIAESGKCLALERGTATVFHLMRVMEAGLKALAAELGVGYAPSWESYIKQLRELLGGNKYETLTADQKAKRPFYQDVLGDLIAIKNAWRNPTMHIVRSYDAGQAGVIFSAVSALMQHVADKLNPAPLLQISTGQFP